MHNGCLNESINLNPVTAYGVAKATLFQLLTQLAHELSFDLTWARLFYMHGIGQSEQSLMSQLRAAVDRADQAFAMSGGEQLRDYMPVSSVAAELKFLLTRSGGSGAVNVCSGLPISVRSLVEQTLADWRKKIQLDLGVYPYPDYEPFAFWGDRSKLESIKATQ